MGWLIALVLAALVGAALLFASRARAVLPIAAASLAAIAGYAWQGSPMLAGHTPPAPGSTTLPDTLFARERTQWLGEFGADNEWLIFADGLERAGLTREAVQAMARGVKRQPQSMARWLGLANALVVHGGGLVSPAATLAFQRADALGHGHPAPGYFFGLALAQAGRFDEASAVWQALLAETPTDATWRGAVQARLAALNAMRAMMQNTPPPQG